MQCLVINCRSIALRFKANGTSLSPAHSLPIQDQKGQSEYLISSKLIDVGDKMNGHVPSCYKPQWFSSLSWSVKLFASLIY